MTDHIADPAIGLSALLQWNEPIGIAFYPDFAEKARLVERARVLAEPRPVLEVASGEDALSLVEKDALIILDPGDTAKAVVEFIDRNRDHFEDKPAQLLLLLLRGGAGEDALRDAPALSSFARSLSFDTADPQGSTHTSAAFKRRHGMEHDEWLRRWRSGELPDTLVNNLVLAEALAIDRNE